MTGGKNWKETPMDSRQPSLFSGCFFARPICFILLILRAAFNASFCVWPEHRFYIFVSIQENSLDLLVGSHSNSKFTRVDLIGPAKVIWVLWSNKQCQGGSCDKNMAAGCLVLWAKASS